jgi:hypothetical protein
MTKNLFVILSFLISIQVFAQLKPETFNLPGDENYLSKILSTFGTNSRNPASNSITDIVTVGDSTVWLGTSRGVSVSFDRGETWTNFYGTEAFGDLSTPAIGYNKYDGSFWASTAKAVEIAGGQFLPEGRGLRFTTNNGETWTFIPQPIDESWDSLIVYGINDGINLPKVRALPVTTAIQNLTYDIAFTAGYVWIASFAGGLRKASIDSLKANPNYKWERVLLPSDSKDSVSPQDTIKFALQPVAGAFGPDNHLNHRLFSVTVVDDTIIYCGSAGGINKSTDGGVSWKKFTHANQQNSISGNWTVALAYNNNRLWAATRRAEGSTEFLGVSSTSDGGESWQTFLRDERVWNFGFKGDNVLAASDNGVFRRSSQGITWILPNAIIDNHSGLELLTTIFYSASSQSNDIWLGSNDGLVKLRESFDSSWTGEWKIYFAAPPLQSNNDTFCYPNPFSPRQEVLKIKYSTGSENKKVTIRIFDFAMNIVKTVIQNADRNNSIDGTPDRWDGRDENGNIVPNGVYFYRVDFDNDDPVFGKVIVLQ